jgi:hypothetical protein
LGAAYGALVAIAVATVRGARFDADLLRVVSGDPTRSGARDDR